MDTTISSRKTEESLANRILVNELLAIIKANSCDNLYFKPHSRSSSTIVRKFRRVRVVGLNEFDLLERKIEFANCLLNYFLMVQVYQDVIHI